MNTTEYTELMVDPLDVARYFLYRALHEDGDTITPLRMQKLVYYAYSYVLVKQHSRLFSDPVQAWINGPVVPKLYSALKDFGRAPIDESFLGEVVDDVAFESWKRATFSDDILATLDWVYEKYMQYTPFELVTLTHREQPWSSARAGLGMTDNSERPISDADILAAYGSR